MNWIGKFDSITADEFQLGLSRVLKVLPIPLHGNMNKTISKFGGADQLRNAINQFQSLLYAA